MENEERQFGCCVYCGGRTETREHVPSKIFLDKPYPEDMAIVYACKKCNGGFSLDEEYVACFIEIARLETTNINLLERKKIRQILFRKPKLTEGLKKSKTVCDGSISFSAEIDRVKNILLKIAVCHILSEQKITLALEKPALFEWGTFDQLSDESKSAFESIPFITLLPEVGSRSLQRLIISKNGIQAPWINVQEGRYRYIVPKIGLVKMVFSEYLWCQAMWK